jgi:hypothetical protein
MSSWSTSQTSAQVTSSEYLIPFNLTSASLSSTSTFLSSNPINRCLSSLWQVSCTHHKNVRHFSPQRSTDFTRNTQRWENSSFFPQHYKNFYGCNLMYTSSVTDLSAFTSAIKTIMNHSNIIGHPVERFSSPAFCLLQGFMKSIFMVLPTALSL